MAYSEIEQYSLDINWYFTDLFNRICVAASAGGLLPKTVAENNERNDQFHKIVTELPSRFEVARNADAFNIIQGISNQNLESYFQDFEALASRGLYVFDKIELDNPVDGFYLLVAYPWYNTNIDRPPLDKNKLSFIPKSSIAIISRFNQVVRAESFKPINLVETLNNID